MNQNIYNIILDSVSAGAPIYKVEVMTALDRLINEHRSMSERIQRIDEAKDEENEIKENKKS